MQVRGKQKWVKTQVMVGVVFTAFPLIALLMVVWKMADSLHLNGSKGFATPVVLMDNLMSATGLLAGAALAFPFGIALFALGISRLTKLNKRLSPL